MSQAKAARESVLVVPAADRAAIAVSGKDRTSWLNGLVTQDLTKVPPGHAAYALLVEKKGRIQADLFVVLGASKLVLGVPVALRDALTTTLEHHLIMEDAELATDDLAFWFSHGPRSAELAAAVAAPYAGTLDLLGTGGSILAGPRELGGAIERHVALLGGAVGDEPTWNALRIERGIPRFGVEFDTSFYPQEASLEARAVSFQKGCYLGQEVVYMLQERGHVKRKLVRLELEGHGPAEPGEPVATPDGEAVGEVRSSTLGPLEGRPVAIAMVKYAQAKPGTPLQVGGRVAVVR